MIAVRLLKRENGRKYGELMKSIMAQYLLDIGVYPKILSAAYDLMENYGEENCKHDEHKIMQRGGVKKIHE